jgi:lipid-binding SYLF domain-containing protein
MTRLPAATVLMSLLVVLAAAVSASANDPERTVRLAVQTLQEIMAIPASQIPASLLADAHGVAIIPNVIKVGFIAGFRRGQGVVLVRGADGNWTAPQFITLTGGSVGWQAGVQGTDVVLVFMTPKSVQGLMNGKFTIGADASAAAGPVGRNASAATDARLQAEILSYSRSRGLFAGVSLDGSAIEVNQAASSMYYGPSPGRVPESALRLVGDVAALSQGRAIVAPAAGSAAVQAPMGTEASRQTLVASTSRLYALVDDQWKQYLALPNDVFQPNSPPPFEFLKPSLDRFDNVASDPKYKALSARPEFKAAHDALRSYAREYTAIPGQQLSLPAPPETSATNVTPTAAQTPTLAK